MTTRVNLMRPVEEADGTFFSRLFDSIENLLKGRSRNAGTLTLTANVTSTTVTNVLFESTQVPVLVPMTSNAAAALATTYVSARTKDSFTLTHANAATTDRTFGYIFVG